MDQKPRYYSCRKWSTFSLCLLNIVSVVAVVIIVIDITAKAIQIVKSVNNNESDRQMDNHIKIMEKAWEMLRTTLIVSTVIVVLIHIFGLFGIFKGHYYLTMIYSVMTTITAVGWLVARFYVAPIFIVLFVINLPLTILGFIFVYDINKRKTMNLSDNFGTIQPQNIDQSNFGQPVAHQATSFQMQTLSPGSLPPPAYGSPGFHFKGNLYQTTI